MAGRAKHAQRSRYGYKERQQMAKTFLSYCYIKNELKPAQQIAKRPGLLARLLRRRTVPNE